MPIEKRVILFSLQELHEGLQCFRAFQDFGVHKLILFEVVRASHLATFDTAHRARFFEALANSRTVYDADSILCRFLHREDHTSRALSLSPETLQEILIEICIRTKVVLPKNAKRSVLIHELHVGLSISLNDMGLNLDLIPEKPAPAKKA